MPTLSVPRTSGTSRPWQARSAPIYVVVVATGIRRIRAARRRRTRLGRVENDLTDLEWRLVRAAWGGCAYCGTGDGALQRDCVLAISRGGRYTMDNVVPACASCNASKCNAEVTSWLRRKGLDERAFLLRYAEVRARLGRDAAVGRPPVQGRS